MSDAARALARLQIAFWVDAGIQCQHCRHVYQSVDDLIERNPRTVAAGVDERLPWIVTSTPVMVDGAGLPLVVDDACFVEWATVHPGAVPPEVVEEARAEFRSRHGLG